MTRAVVCLALLARDTNVENGVAPRAGLSALKPCGGITAVQDPSDAAIPEMPTTTLTRLEPDHVVGLAGMPRVETLPEIHRQPCSITRPLRRALMSAWVKTGNAQREQMFSAWPSSEADIAACSSQYLPSHIPLDEAAASDRHEHKLEGPRSVSLRRPSMSRLGTSANSSPSKRG
jgi:hypothetical protein